MKSKYLEQYNDLMWHLCHLFWVYLKMRLFHLSNGANPFPSLCIYAAQTDDSINR